MENLNEDCTRFTYKYYLFLIRRLIHNNYFYSSYHLFLSLSNIVYSAFAKDKKKFN